MAEEEEEEQDEEVINKTDLLLRLAIFEFITLEEQRESILNNYAVDLAYN